MRKISVPNSILATRQQNIEPQKKACIGIPKLVRGYYNAEDIETLIEANYA